MLPISRLWRAVLLSLLVGQLLPGWGPNPVWAQDAPTAPGLIEEPSRPPAAAGGQPSVPLAEISNPNPMPATESASPESVAPAPAARSDKPIVALLDYETDTLEDGQVGALSQALWARLNLTGDMGLLPRGPARRWLIRYDLYPFTPYRQPISLDVVTRALKSDYLVSGHIDRLDGVFVLDVSLYSRPAGKAILEDAKLRKATLEQMLEGMGGLASQLHTAIMRDAAQRLGLTPPALSLAPESEKAAPKPEPSEAKGSRGTSRALPPAKETPTIKAVRKKKKSLASRQEPAEAIPEHKETGQTPEPKPSRAEHAPSAAGEEAASTAPSPKPREEQPRAGQVAKENASPAPSATPLQPEQGNIEKARQLYQDAQKHKAKTPERLELLRQAAALMPAELLYQQQLATELYLQGQYQACVESCERALRLNPGVSMLLTIKGSAYFELDKFEQAGQANEAALAIDPNNLWARYNLALTLTMQKSPKARQAWDDYLARAQNEPSQKGLVEEARRHRATLDPAEVK